MIEILKEASLIRKVTMAMLVKARDNIDVCDLIAKEEGNRQSWWAISGSMCRP